ncbi:BREX-1 system adenine-specific DNA-methyltransferase PglX [Methanospirillum purgamenti]|uniref:site-specific DNA-methyltransferase (adenine-specific) n=1 Tax=Methanospirillum hungatei TaxID=2203 RepID=A0A8F5ZFM7_METHU|nr:BREX-1 system adenine-specific DNA-methyltransferase PglX [Methanospirillum hungatei]QXO96042.1 BREX-1 system adenine-specific DNA-methyltransferase PglX [Methanospirillum hungatei]
MDPEQKKILRPLCLNLRHILEGYYDTDDVWHAGDLEQRLNSLGIWWDRDPLPAEQLTHLSPEDKNARTVIDAYLALRDEAGIDRKVAVEEFVRETAYSWANRLLILRCMESRGLIDEVIITKDSYGGRSLALKRIAEKSPQLCTGQDGGLFAMLDAAFSEHAKTLPGIFDPQAPGVALRPSVAALKECIALLSGTQAVSGKIIADDSVFSAPDALGWAYQYWNGEEKDRVFEQLRTKKGKKIEGAAEIIPATQLYTEPYMVKFLVQNSLGAIWMQMHPESNLCSSWEYYVKDADRAPVKQKNVASITFLDPACGSGHFLIEAFDILYQMYEAEGKVTEPDKICKGILSHNLFGIDIDERAVQIARAALWMKAATQVFEFTGTPKNLVATNIRLPKEKDHLAEFLAKHPEDKPLSKALEAIFDGLAHVDELGSLVQIEEPVKKELEVIRKGLGGQATFGGELSGQTMLMAPKSTGEYEEWQAGVMDRIREQFSAEAERANPTERFFSQAAVQGMQIVDLLSRRYDVVAANPPYMGSGNMGSMLKKYVERHYSEGKRDLYAAFILRNLGLNKKGGKVAMVTQQSWMFLGTFSNFRARFEEKGKDVSNYNFKGLLRESSIELLAHLGPHAFEEIGGEVVSTVLFILSNQTPHEKHEILTYRLTGCCNAADKQKGLINKNVSDIKKINQLIFTRIENSPLVYYLEYPLIEILIHNQKLSSLSQSRQGLASANNARFVRLIHEINYKNTLRWVIFVKAGRFQKWTGLENYLVDWGSNGSRIKNSVIEKYTYLKGDYAWVVKNESTYFKEGWTYTKVVSGLGFRKLNSCIYSHGSNSVFFNEDFSDSLFYIGILNSHLSTFFARAISQKLGFESGYIERLPIPSLNSFKNLISRCVEIALFYKGKNCATELLEKSYNFREKSILDELIIIIVEGIIEKLSFESFEIDESSQDLIIYETGTPAGWFPLITNYDSLPSLPDDIPKLPQEVIDYLITHHRISLNDSIKPRLRSLYEAGPGAKEDEPEEPAGGDEEETVVGARIPIPAETFLEELSQKLEIHPISIYWLLQEGIAEGWRCIPEEQRILADRYTVLILQMLGHRWPKQIEAGEPVPAWADDDGIIPITGGCGESTLLERVRERLTAEGEDLREAERYFTEVMGSSLEAWLTTTFFKHHTKQFKKRPVAWQLQSGAFTKKKTPAFACFVYYQAMNQDTIPKIRSQYVGTLRQRYETQLRDLEGISDRSEDQDRRVRELSELIGELKAFDKKLEELAKQGFACKKLEEIVRGESLDNWCSIDGVKPFPSDAAGFLAQEQAYVPDINDGVRVNVAPVQKAGVLAADVIAKKDVEKAIADRAEWRADERRWCREGKLPKCGWW